VSGTKREYERGRNKEISKEHMRDEDWEISDRKKLRAKGDEGGKLKEWGRNKD
jgi:hypothetical protein